MRRSLLVLLLVLGLPLGAAASAISDALDAMAPDTWATFATPAGVDATTFIHTGAQSEYITGDSTTGCWDVVRQEAHFISKGHKDGDPTRHIKYIASTNTWVRLTDPPNMSAAFGEGHAFTYGPVCDNRGRKLYRGYYNTLRVRIYDLDTQTWSLSSQPPGGVMAFANCCAGMAWHYEREKAGQLIFGNIESTPNGVVIAYTPATDSWARINTSGSLYPMSSDVTQMAYNYVSKVTVVGNSSATYRVSGDTNVAVSTAATNPCFPRSNRGATFFPDPTNGNFIWLCGGESQPTIAWHTYDPVADTFTAKANPTTIPNHILNISSTPWANWGAIGIPLEDHGGILFIRCSGSGGGVTCPHRLYKGATAWSPSKRDLRRQCLQSGIIKCNPMEVASDIASDSAQSKSGTGWCGTATPPSLDTSTGVSALKFVIAAGATGSTAGCYGMNFSRDFSIQIKPTGGYSNTYYGQFQFRIDNNFATSTQGVVHKMMWLAAEADRQGTTQANQPTSCTQVEVVLQPYDSIPDILGGYRACPSDNPGGSQQLLTQECGAGNPNCTSFNPNQRQLQSVVPCFYGGSKTACVRISTNPNTWRTVTFRMKFASNYQNNGVYAHDSEIEAWLAEEATPTTRIKFLNIRNEDAACPSLTSVQQPSNICGIDIPNTHAIPGAWGKLWFAPYSLQAGNEFSAGGTLWIRYVIVSLTDPGDPGAPPPAPPVGGGMGRLRIRY